LYEEIPVNIISSKSIKLAAIAAVLSGAFLAAGCSITDSGKGGAEQVAADENSGSLGLNLTLSNGAKITAVQATITGSGLSAPINRTIPVPSDQSTVSALFGGLPGGAYSIALSAQTADGKTSCSGSATFTVVAAQTVGVVVPLTCNTDTVRGKVLVNGEINVCPEVTFLYVAPLQTEVGGTMIVEASASDADGDTLAFAWTSTNGSFVNPALGTTTYNCSAPGDQTLTLTMNDQGDCSTSVDVAVRCEPTAVCGDAVVESDKGELCDPPNGVTCDANCQTITTVCGNSIVQPGEQCDPPNGTTCNTTCETIVCGDGTVEGAEQCEPPNSPRGAGNCDATCKTIPSVCGNNVREPGEECEPPGTAACDATCQDTGASACDICVAGSCPGPVADQAAKCTGTTCNAYLSGQETTGCANSDVRSCYCGAVDFAACFNSFDANVPQGPCKSQINGLAGTSIPLQVGTQFFDATTPLGAVNQVNLCTNNNCDAACP
jgi:hypothetical protein